MFEPVFGFWPLCSAPRTPRSSQVDMELGWEAPHRPLDPPPSGKPDDVAGLKPLEVRHRGLKRQELRGTHPCRDDAG